MCAKVLFLADMPKRALNRCITQVYGWRYGTSGMFGARNVSTGVDISQLRTRLFQFVEVGADG